MTDQPFSKITPWREDDGTIAFMPVRDDFAAPRRFTASSDTVSIDVEVDADGHGRCLAIRVAAPDGEDITSASLRLPVAKLVRQAVAGASRLYAPLVEDGEPVFHFVSTSPVRAAEYYESYVKDARRPRSGVAVTDDTLRAVAELYRAALERGDPPTQTVAEQMHASRSTAARWVGKARQRGMLGASLRSRAGEQR